MPTEAERDKNLSYLKFIRQVFFNALHLNRLFNGHDCFSKAYSRFAAKILCGI
jgi:hypothetical protein